RDRVLVAMTHRGDGRQRPSQRVAGVDDAGPRLLALDLQHKRLASTTTTMARNRTDGKRKS
ncbi:MAG: hypothetical protein PVF77_07905, partial [Anaerolineae bacterium]